LVLVAAPLTIVFGMTGTVRLVTPIRVVFRPSYVRSIGPIESVLRGYVGEPLGADPTPSPSIRAVVVNAQSIRLISGGRLFRSFAATGTTLGALAQEVRAPSWISVDPTTHTAELGAALIVTTGGSLVIGAPLRQVVLKQSPGVFIGSDGGALAFNGVEVTSNATTQTSSESPRFRPFIVAEHRSRISADGATFTNLGWDWNGSYGFSVMSGSTGLIEKSTFIRDFIGLYTDHVSGYKVTSSEFEANALYGIDPHSFSSRLAITHNIVENNAAHGIIFSNHVSHSTVADNVSRGNGENGIMMDEFSMSNRIAGNSVTNNRGDGVVLSSSASNRLINNEIHRNRIGISVYGNESGAPTLVGNVVSRNRQESSGVSINASTNVVGNNFGIRLVPPPSWHSAITLLLWPLIGALFLVAVFVRRRELRALPSSRRREDPSGVEPQDKGEPLVPLGQMSAVGIQSAGQSHGRSSSE
jgi:poly(beta-D-mannuronate) C5 epimerase